MNKPTTSLIHLFSRRKPNPIGVEGIFTFDAYIAEYTDIFPHSLRQTMWIDLHDVKVNARVTQLMFEFTILNVDFLKLWLTEENYRLLAIDIVPSLKTAYEKPLAYMNKPSIHLLPTNPDRALVPYLI